MKSRLTALQKKLQPHQALFITQPSQIYYFSGFEFLVPEEKEAYLVVTVDDSYLLHGIFNAVPNHDHIQNLAGLYQTKLIAHLTKIKSDHQLTEFLIDKNYIYLSEAELLQEIGFKLKQTDMTWFSELRVIKDSDEITKMRQAGKIVTQTWEKVKPQIKAGVTEQEISVLLQTTMLELGSSEEAFPTIVAFGENTALPHHQPTSKKLENNMAVLCDFGATYQGYRSDMTRNVWVGETVDPEYQNITRIVEDAYQAVIEKLQNWLQKSDQQQAELTALDLDSIARNLIKEAGYDKEFNHTTGHGIGIDIHEVPSISWRNKMPLKSKMIFTVEPGIYLLGKFGVRYENTILLGDKVEELTKI
jgi:Xaa-Pro aminopeptidase